MNDLIQSIMKMTPVGNRLELPKHEQLANYAQVKKALITAGGRYKSCGFVFTDDASAVQDRLVGGEVIDDKKKYQFFATPDPLAEQLVEMAEIESHHYCLEPSAGQGAIAGMMLAVSDRVTVVELMPANIQVLTRKGYKPYQGDFLKMAAGYGSVDRIVANPPFTKNQDIDHIRHMHSKLAPGGKLVSMASKSWTFGGQKKQVAFREWLQEVGATVTEVPAGAFKPSGTTIASVIIEITRGGE
jgi:hypothetical protein